jgi:prophage regulatory protein
MATPIPFDRLPDAALLREREMIQILPFSSPTLWRRVKTGEFPQPVRLPGRMTCWRWGDVRDWLDSHGRAVA